VALVLTVETRQRQRGIDVEISIAVWCGRRKRRQVGASSCAGFIRTIWTVAKVVVDLGRWELDGGIGYTREAVFRLVESRNCNLLVVSTEPL